MNPPIGPARAYACARGAASASLPLVALILRLKRRNFSKMKSFSFGAALREPVDSPVRMVFAALIRFPRYFQWSSVMKIKADVDGFARAEEYPTQDVSAAAQTSHAAGSEANATAGRHIKASPATALLREELHFSTMQVFTNKWTSCLAHAVPVLNDLRFVNETIRLDAAVLYADLDGSTLLVDTHHPQFAAQIYKSYLLCAAKIINAQGGAITAYDGDRIMGVFVGEEKESKAVKAALMISYAVNNVINPDFKESHEKDDYLVKQVVGVDTSELHVARIGVPQASDLVWIGRAANYAAKLSAIDDVDRIFITANVYDRINEELRFYGKPRRNLWKRRQWHAMNDLPIYSSDWTLDL
jgi:class 3 adenylate cyclase